MLIEKFKGDRLEGITRNKRQRCPATVNREFDVLSKVFSLAIDCKKAHENPCSKVRKLRVSNQRYRYLLPEEQPLLLAALDGPRAHLKPAYRGSGNGDALGRGTSLEAATSGLLAQPCDAYGNKEWQRPRHSHERGRQSGLY